MNSERADAIKQMPLPTNKKQLQSFLGVVNYYRIFVPNFADIAAPLYSLLRKNTTFVWTSAQTTAVENLREKLYSAPIVKFPDYKLPFHLYTDASNSGIGAVLMHEHKGVLHPLTFVSKTLNSAQKPYSTTKNEALALVWALEQF